MANANRQQRRKKQFGSKTFVNVILDKSGSMERCLDATISAFNEYFNSLKNEKKMFITLTTFNDAIDIEYRSKPVAEIQLLSKATYVPIGSTALYDAIASAVKVGSEISENDRVLNVIITDGEENCSRETTRQQVVDLIAAKEATGKWTFAYLGANQDSWAVGQQLGLSRGNVMDYAASPEGYASAAVGLRQATLTYAANVASNSHKFFSNNTDSSNNVDWEQTMKKSVPRR